MSKNEHYNYPTIPSKMDRIKSLLRALQLSPCMYNDEANLETLRSFVQRYNRWVTEIRNPVYQDEQKDWLKVCQALSDLSALRSLAKNLKPFEDVDLYGGEKVTITIKKLDGTTQELNGDWLPQVASAELEDGDEE